MGWAGREPHPPPQAERLLDLVQDPRLSTLQEDPTAQGSQELALTVGGTLPKYK